LRLAVRRRRRKKKRDSACRRRRSDECVDHARQETEEVDLPRKCIVTGAAEFFGQTYVQNHTNCK
jgi:hypothetical protein